MTMVAGVETYELRDALAQARAVLRGVRRKATSLAFADDPLRLDLPPLLDTATRPSPATLRLTGTLYLQSELEQAGLVTATELLVRSRDLIGARQALALKLEEYAQAMRGTGSQEWLDPTRRAQLFARLFGVGVGATMASVPAGINRAFEQLLASFCVALLRLEAAYHYTPVPDTMRDAAARFAARALLLNVGARQYGVSSVTVARLDQQLRRSIAILADDELSAILGIRGVWPITSWVLGEGAPDSGRHSARGAAGQSLLLWLATMLPLLADERSTTPLPRDNTVFAAAARWVVASGLSVSGGLVQ